MASPLVIAKYQQSELSLLPALANRHGLITGATGTGKTITLQVLAERFSNIGVPVFMADVKGDLSGLAAPGIDSTKLKQRLDSLGTTDARTLELAARIEDAAGDARAASRYRQRMRDLPTSTATPSEGGTYQP